MNFATEPCHDEQHVVEQVLVVVGSSHLQKAPTIAYSVDAWGMAPPLPRPGKEGGRKGSPQPGGGVLMQHG